MLTILVTGSDTDIGKTRVAAAIARLLWHPGLRLQFVKPVETGRAAEESGDATEAARESGIEEGTTFTLARFLLPLAPLAAAQASGLPPPTSLLDVLLEKWSTLPPADLRIVEGAGGIAVPLDADGSDWCDFARAIQANRIVLVTPDRLGGINQGRLVNAYANSHNLPAGIWLNEVRPQNDAIRQSNREGLAGCPVWATQRFGASLPEDPDHTIRSLTGNAQ